MYAIELYGYLFIIGIVIGILLLLAADALFLWARHEVERQQYEKKRQWEAHRRHLIETYGIECFNRSRTLSPLDIPHKAMTPQRKEAPS